jgi:hypothetical protein
VLPDFGGGPGTWTGDMPDVGSVHSPDLKVLVGSGYRYNPHDGAVGPVDGAAPEESLGDCSLGDLRSQGHECLCLAGCDL